MFTNRKRITISLYVLLQLFTYSSTYTVERKKSGDIVLGVPECVDGTRVAQNDTTRSHQCVKQMNSPVTDCDLLIDGNHGFGAIDQSDIDNKTQWKIAPQGSVFPFCRDDRRAAVGFVKLHDYPNSLKAPIWNERYGRVIKKTLNLTIGNKSMVLEAKKLFPGHLFKIFIDCIDDQNVWHRAPKGCVLFKYVGKYSYPVVESSLGVIPTTLPPPTNPTTNPPLSTIAGPGTTISGVSGVPNPSTTPGNMTTPTPTPKSDAQKSGDVTDWTLIGILIGILLLIILILLIVCLICKRRKDKRRQEKMSKAETKAIEQNVLFRDNPTFVVLDVNAKKQNTTTSPKSPTGKTPTKGTGTVDSPDGSKITSSAYLFMAGKDPEVKAVPPAEDSKKDYDPVKLNIDMKNKQGTENGGYNVI